MGPVWRLRLGYGSCSAFPTRSSTATVCYSRTLGAGVRKASHQLLASVFSSIQLAEQGGGGCLTTVHHPQNSSQGQLKIPACSFSSNLGFNLG